MSAVANGGRHSAALRVVLECGMEALSSRAELGEVAGAAEVDFPVPVELLSAFPISSWADVLVVAGNGLEQGQEFAGGRKIPFDDVTVVREILRGDPVDAAS